MKRNTGPPGDGGNKKRPAGTGLWGDTTGRVKCQHLHFHSSTYCQPGQQPCPDRFNLPLSLLIDQSIQLVERHDQQAYHHELEAAYHRNRADSHRQVLAELQKLIPQRVQQIRNSVKDISPKKDGTK